MPPTFLPESQVQRSQGEPRGEPGENAPKGPEEEFLGKWLDLFPATMS